MEDKKDPRGRKKTEDPKVNVRLWIHQSSIDKLGGLSATQDMAYSFFKRKLKSIK